MASSGTTGPPTYIPFSDEELSWFSESHARIMWSFGIRPNMGILIAAMFSLYAGAWGVYLGFMRLGLKVISVGAGYHGATNNVLKALQHHKPEVLYATPSFILYILEKI